MLDVTNNVPEAPHCEFLPLFAPAHGIKVNQRSTNRVTRGRAEHAKAADRPRLCISIR